MFGNSRRYRPPNPPRYSATANPNATSAAASAFMSTYNQRPDKTLSSAAAAAALGARPHTPTNVGQVQTKRTMRRSASVSSAGSNPAAAASRPVGQLERKASSGSMTERTFRSPSPRRSTSNQVTEERPPVPQIPAGHKKSASAGIGMQPFRTASQKMKTGHPSWYTQPSGDPSNVRTSDAPMKTGKPQLPKPQTVTSPQRPDSRSSSVNYSYPISFRPQSPPESPTSAQAAQFANAPPRRPVSPPRSNRASISSAASIKSDRPMVYDPNSRRMIPKPMSSNAEYVRESAGKRPKARDSDVRREGSSAVKGTTARNKGTTVDSRESERALPKREKPVAEATPSVEEAHMLDEPAVKAIMTEPRTARKHQGQPESEQTPQPQDVQKPGPTSPPPDQHISHNPNPNSPARLILGKTPSIVQEESDEEIDSMARPPQKVLDALDAVPTRLSIERRASQSQPSQERANEPVEKEAWNGTFPEQAESSKSATREKRAVFVENKPVAELSRESSSSRRSNSNSPARQAHFSATPPDILAVRHAPLPRSASPIKSALKHTSPGPREVSPSDQGSEVPLSRQVSPQQREDSATARKKSVRVSFDDRAMATVVGESALAGEADSPASSSPQQSKRHWFSNIGRSKRRDYTLEDDEIMKPRPALPSFGSVREQKTREPEERPLVRPYDPNHPPAAPSSPVLRPSSSSAAEDGGLAKEGTPGQSSDHVIGSVLSQEQISRNAPNISRFREPLPPVVTTVEGSGYISDSIRSSDSDGDLLDSVAGASDGEDIPSTQATQLETEDNSQNNSVILEREKPANAPVEASNQTDLEKDVPEITIIQPSPRIPEQGKSAANQLEDHYFEVPGGFPEADANSTDISRTTSKASENEVASAAASSSIFEPQASVHPAQPEALPQTTLATTASTGVDNDNSTDSEASIYSDAYEDPAEMDGFMSLDAVVESPVSKTTSRIPELPGDMPEEVDLKESRPQVSQQLPIATPTLAQPQEKGDWEQAKAFWRSLSTEKRRQLEREATEEAGTEGDAEDLAHPVRRNNSKRKSAQRQRKDAKDQSRISTVPAGPIRVPDPERVYMIQPGSKANHEPISPPPASSRMRTSLRAEQPGPNGMRKTMRPQSMTQQINESPRRTTPRESSAQVNLSKTNRRQNSVISTEAMSKNDVFNDKPSLQRRGSDASDSSFKRSRATRGGSFGLRTSMRPSSSMGSSHEAARGSGRFSLRSLSPAGSPFRQNSAANGRGPAPAGMMKRTLRSSSVSSQDRVLPSISFPSFGRSSKASAAKRSKKTSRFGDSDDEDGGGGAPNFHSRFDDSSNEDDARPSTSHPRPLSKGTLRASTADTAGFRMATPVPELEEDSPELPDSDDEMPSPLQSPRNQSRATMVRTNSGALGTATLTRSRSGRGGLNSSVTIPATPNKDRRSSLMGILKRNKRGGQAGKIQRSAIMDSAARRDTKLERSSEQLRGIRSDQPSSPKLQKRASVRRNGSWPLVEAAEGNGVRRTNSAGNLLEQNGVTGAAQRPTLEERRSTSLGLPATYDTGYLGEAVDGTGQRKKKKFGALRRMFGLDN
ncbi:hypothetical protein GGR52DRAFT_415500 [Hypoxylon sp. FL1284]|nr:hypothetical protein GGR52DRAFT_415500 [Hypoxylon sp. FL1284]